MAGLARLGLRPVLLMVLTTLSMGGAVLAFELDGDGADERRARAWRLIDGTEVMSITGNLGDTRTTITHPATTTHGRLTPEARARAGITEGLVRISVGIEDVADLHADIDQAIGASVTGRRTS
jgi:O-succinylhomoserine sulfhydrylase